MRFSDSLAVLLPALLLLGGPLFAQTIQTSPSALHFGNKVVTETGSNVYSVTFNNTGNDTLTFTSAGITIEGADAADFFFMEPPTTTPLASNSSPREVTIAFAPKLPGPKSATLVFKTNDPEFPTKGITFTAQGLPHRGTLITGDYTGYGPGQSTIGVGGDFPSLEAAAQAISSRPLTGGDWTFLILNDLMEPNNSFIGQRNTNGNTITIRPAPVSSSTITFTTNTLRIGFSNIPGHLVIGGKIVSSGSAPRWVAEPTDNIKIDGSGAAGDTAKRLSFKNRFNPGSADIIHIMGDSDNVQVRNCKFETYAQLSGPIPVPATVSFLAMQRQDTTGAAIPLFDIPDYGLVENCDFLTSNPNVMSIAYNNRTGYHDPGSNFAPSKRVQILNNTIRTYGGGIAVRYAEDPLITSNTITINPLHTWASNAYSLSTGQLGILYMGLIQRNVNQPPSYARILANQIYFVGDRPTSSSFMGIAVGSQDHSTHCLIANNIISGLTAPAVGYANSIRYGINNYGDNFSTATIVHNSINFRRLLGTGDTTATYCSAVANGHITFRGNTVLCNNIIRFPVSKAAAIIRHTGPGSFVSNNNNIFTSNEGMVGYSGFRYYPTLADWQTLTGQDLASVSLDPFVAAGEGLGAWIGPADSITPDVHFTSFPGAGYLVPKVEGIDTDIDGDPRSGTQVIMGADEPTHSRAKVNEWQLY